jgi:hypothetical protein
LLFSFVDMGSLARALREDVAATTSAEVIECLQQDEAFTSATSFREQCFHACRILRKGHAPRVSLELIGLVLRIERGTIYNH